MERTVLDGEGIQEVFTMSKIYTQFQELIGNTPLFRMQNFERKNNLSAQINISTLQAPSKTVSLGQ